MKGVIMAGGMGKRLRPLTCKIPKPMVPLVHKPVMEYCIELLKKNGVTEIAVTLQYKSEVIKNYFGDGSKYGVHLYYFEESTPLGTAGSIKNIEHFLDERFIVISGDGLTDFDLNKGIMFHDEKRALVTIFMKRYTSPCDFGIIMTNEKNEVVRFHEKPSFNELFSNTVNTGIYVLDPNIFKYIQKGVTTDFSRDLFPYLLKKEGKIYGYKAEGYWCDVGNLNSYRQAQFDLLSKKVNVKLSGKEVREGIWLGENAVIEEGVTLQGPLSIGNGVVVRKGTLISSHSIIGNNSTIAINSTLEDSILWNDIYIGPYSELKGTTICKGVQLESSVSLSEDSVIGENCKISANALVQPEVKVWPNKEISEAAIVRTSLIVEKSKSSQKPINPEKRIHNF